MAKEKEFEEHEIVMEVFLQTTPEVIKTDENFIPKAELFHRQILGFSFFHIQSVLNICLP